MAKGDISSNPANQLSGVGANARYRRVHDEDTSALDPGAPAVSAASSAPAYRQLPDFGEVPDIKAVEAAGEHADEYSPADLEKLFGIVVSLIGPDEAKGPKWLRGRLGAGREAFDITPDLTR